MIAVTRSVTIPPRLDAHDALKALNNIHTQVLNDWAFTFGSHTAHPADRPAAQSNPDIDNLRRHALQGR